MLLRKSMLLLVQVAHSAQAVLTFFMEQTNDYFRT
jgi:hypothetical protein